MSLLIRWRSAAALGWALTASGMLPSALAQDSAEREAREWFDAADRAAEEGRVADAVEGYERSLSLAPRVNTAVNLALVLVAAGRASEAGRVANDVLDGRFGLLTPEVRARIESIRDRALQRISTLVVSIVGVGRATVRVDGVLMADARRDAPLELSVDPGAHVLVARAPSGETVERQFEARPGRLELVLRFEPARAGPEPRLVESPDDTSLLDEAWLHVVLGVALAAGIASLVIGTVLANAPPSDPVWGRADLLIAF